VINGDTPPAFASALNGSRSSREPRPELVRRLTHVPNAARAQELSLQPSARRVPMVVKLPTGGKKKQKRQPPSLEIPGTLSSGNYSPVATHAEVAENEEQMKLFENNEGSHGSDDRQRWYLLGALALLCPLGILLIALWVTGKPLLVFGSSTTTTVSTSTVSTTTITTATTSATTGTHTTTTNPEDEFHVSNLPATGRLPPVGNSLQILTNGLIYADASRKKSVKVSGRIRQVLSIFLDFPDSGEIKMLPRVTGRRLEVSDEVRKCKNYSAWVECKVSLTRRAEVMRRYVTPMLKKGCLKSSGTEYPLTIHLRTNEWCCESQAYVQPPCAWYDEVLGHENNGGPFKSAEIFADHKEHPCARDLLRRSGTGWVSGAKLAMSSGDLYTDICGIMSSRRLVLPRSTFSFNLALLNPHPARLFVPLPCEGCWLDGFLFFNLAKRSNMTLFLQELCKVFPSSVAYAMPKTYIDVAAKMQNGEMLWREHFRGPHLKWVRSACIGTTLDTSSVDWVNV